MFTFLAILITIFVVAFAQFNQTDLALQLMYTDMKFDMSLLSFAVITYSLGIVSGVFLMLKAVFKSAKEHGKVKRRLEKTAVGADDSELKVKTLENKIATLESALQKVMKQDKAVLKEAEIEAELEEKAKEDKKKDCD